MNSRIFVGALVAMLLYLLCPTVVHAQSWSVSLYSIYIISHAYVGDASGSLSAAGPDASAAAASSTSLSDMLSKANYAASYEYFCTGGPSASIPQLTLVAAATGSTETNTNNSYDPRPQEEKIQNPESASASATSSGLPGTSDSAPPDYNESNRILVSISQDSKTGLYPFTGSASAFASAESGYWGSASSQSAGIMEIADISTIPII